MKDLAFLALTLSAIYCAGMWLFLAVRSFRTGENLEVETFHLGLCFVIAASALYLG